MYNFSMKHDTSQFTQIFVCSLASPQMIASSATTLFRFVTVSKYEADLPQRSYIHFDFLLYSFFCIRCMKFHLRVTILLIQPLGCIHANNVMIPTLSLAHRFVQSGNHGKSYRFECPWSVLHCPRTTHGAAN